jgi:hypothetical protein
MIRRLLFPTICKAVVSVLAFVPGAVATTYGLIQAAEKTGFDKASPGHHQKLVSLSNGLLWLLVEHWIAIIICSVMLGTFWAFMVVEPRVASKDKFEERRRRR